MKPLLRWLEQDNLRYHLNTSPLVCTTTTYADDLVIVTDNIQHIEPQKFVERSYMDLNISKCIITRCPNKSKHLQIIHPITKNTYKSKTFPTLMQKQTIHIPRHLPNLITQMEPPEKPILQKPNNKATINIFVGQP